MPWCIDQVDVVFLLFSIVSLLYPVTERRCGLNSDTLFTLEIHRVHLGTNIVTTANFVDGLDPTSVEEDSFGTGGFSAVNVCL